MYNFVFYFIYRSQINQKDGGPFVARYVASIILIITLVIHVGLIYSFFRYFLFNFYRADISFSLGKTYSSKFVYWAAIFFLLVFFVFKYFNLNRIEKIVGKYHQRENFYSFMNILKFTCIISLPLIFAIILVNHSISGNG
jgi:hypothetical protein